MKEMNLEQKSPEWLQWRRERVTASEIAVVLNLSPYMTPYQLWGEKLGIFERPDLSKNPHVQRGVEMEPKVASFIEQSSDLLELAKPFINSAPMLIPVVAESTDYPHIGASFDGLHYCFDTKNYFVYEIKYPSSSTWLEVCLLGRNSKAFQLYVAQVHQQMLVADAPAGMLVFSQLDDQGKLQTKPFLIERDKDWDKKIIRESKKFADSVSNREAPKMDPLRDTYFPKNGQDLVAWQESTTQIHVLQNQIDELRSKMTQLEDAKKQYRDKLSGHMNGFKTASYDGVTLTRSVRQGAIDVPKLLTGENISLTDEKLDQYRKQDTHVLQLRVSDKKTPEFPKPKSIMERECTSEAASSDFF